MSGMIKGNGKSLGWTDGTTDYGTNSVFVSSTLYGLLPATAYLNKNVSTTSISPGNYPPNGSIVGINTDSAKSGIIVERNSSKYLNFYIN